MIEHDYTRDQVVGCLLAGAVGDALGARAVDDRENHADHDDTAPAATFGRTGPVTDATRMTVFTAEGLIRAAVRKRERGICHPPTVLHHAYLRWFATRGSAGVASPHLAELDGWIVGVPELWRTGDPDDPGLTALRTGRMGSTDGPINDAPGYGALVRAAPAGILAARRRFELGCEFAAITHGHPSGIYPAGALAVIVGALVDGADLTSALDRAEGELREPPRAATTLTALRAGRSLGTAGIPTPDDLASLGSGDTGHEVLAIAVACAVGGYDRPGAALRASVDHPGARAAAGSVCGNILGAAHGTRWLLPTWLEELELREVVARLAEDCHRACRIGVPTEVDGTVTADWLRRYPGW
ncbi:ADP-ribosylglycohydrolase family protein [Mobilicoccus caccae]|uniref:ADP-ribosylglycohydrolase n=1 Tax=Mobilicoccus caccae TaxID=1859295 RepID=A0ABQ6IXH0_9MICO|nr:ADP-ribosylglycohydrolase family protein [Mobilicoccus caccae]GMA41437.1 hypothetical protein GCM10025883_34820 [Mobilicoccus caccae]